MYVERVSNRNSPPAVLLRECFREDGKVKKRTLANLSKWPDELLRGLRILLKGGVALKFMDDAFEILRSRPHGHAKLDLVVQATKHENRLPRGMEDIAVRADRALRAHKVGKHFTTTATDDGFSYERDEARIAEEAGRRTGRVAAP